MSQASTVRAGVFALFTSAAQLVFPNPSLAQSCDDADAQSTGGITCPPCTEYFGYVACAQSGNVKSKVLCQPANWNNGQDFGWQTFNATNAIADCGDRNSGDPECFPEITGPFVYGQVSGKWEFRYIKKAGSATTNFPTGNVICLSNGATTTQVHNTISLVGCCATACSSSAAQAQCAALPGVYSGTPNGCSCDPPPECADRDQCVGDPPCETTQHIDTACGCCKPGGDETSPIVINLRDGDIRFSSPLDGVLFDIMANGAAVRISWPVSPRTYWLALDRNMNGRVDNGSELFGNYTRLSNGQLAPNGYAALAEFDENADGRIDSSDPIYGALVLWRHPIGESAGRPDEYVHLADAGVTSISLAFRESRRSDEWGNEFRYRSKVMIGNKARWSYDVFVVIATPEAKPSRGARLQMSPMK
jgi:hypothetical protein